MMAKKCVCVYRGDVAGVLPEASDCAEVSRISFKLTGVEGVLEPDAAVVRAVAQGSGRNEAVSRSSSDGGEGLLRLALSPMMPLLPFRGWPAGCSVNPRLL